VADPAKKSKLPSSIDPGWATVIAASLALIGVILTVWLQKKPASPPATPLPAITETAIQASSATATPTQVTVGAATPMPQIVSVLPAAQKVIVQNASQSLLDASQGLPLIVSDDFDNNDYSWPIFDEIYTGGIECNTVLEDSAFHINIHSADGPAYCIAGLTKVAVDFTVSADTQIVNQRNADVYLYYRVSEDGLQFYYVQFNPQTQMFSVGINEEGVSKTIIGLTFIEEINKTGTNKITVLAVGSSHAVYLNDKLIAIFVDDRLTEGQLRLVVQINEANQDETLWVDHFELRGN